MQSSIPSFKLIIEEWDTYCILADMPYSNASRLYNRVSGRRTKEIWEVVDKSLPIILDEELWFIRVMDHKLKGIHIDIRKFERMEDKTKEWFIPSDNGLCIKLGNWIKLFDPLFKLIRKWKGK